MENIEAVVNDDGIERLTVVLLQTLRCGCKVEGCGVQCLGEVNLGLFDYLLFEIECDKCGEFYIDVIDTLTYGK